jgi:hypothetical protein
MRVPVPLQIATILLLAQAAFDSTRRGPAPGAGMPRIAADDPGLAPSHVPGSLAPPACPQLRDRASTPASPFARIKFVGEEPDPDPCADLNAPAVRDEAARPPAPLATRLAPAPALPPPLRLRC